MISRFLPIPVRRLLGVKVTTRPPAYQLLDQPGSLAPLLHALDRVHEVALDTEADNMFHYKTRVCLMQLLVGKEVYLVDMLAPAGGLDAMVEDLAGRILANSWFTNGAVKRLMIESDGLSLVEGLAHEHSRHPGFAPDYRERIERFSRKA